MLNTLRCQLRSHSSKTYHSIAAPAFRITARAMHTQPRFSPGTDEAAATGHLSSLLVSEGGRWTLANDGEAIERSFKFKTFAKAWDFMTAVSLQCKIKHHHPEWSNVYNTTYVRWTTHNPKGLSALDLDMADACDAIASDLGELEPEPVSCAVRDVADKATVSAGDCCTPKK
ncbi:hypothetical protein ACO1O0_004212 [Amphichorda felina]